MESENNKTKIVEFLELKCQIIWSLLSFKPWDKFPALIFSSKFG